MKLVALGLVFALLASGCVQQQEIQQKEETIKIGAVLPLTGIASVHGQNERQGIELAVKEINNGGGINGKKLQVIYEDDETQPQKTLTAVKKLSEIDKVPLIIGGTWDILANAVIPELDKGIVVLLSPSALPDTVTQTSPYFFSVHSPVAVNQNAFEKFLDKLPRKRVAAIVVNNPWGLAHLETFRKAANASNATIVQERILQNFDNNDLWTELTAFKEADVDAIFATLNFNDMALFGRRRAELNLTSQILAHSNFASAIEAGRLPVSSGEGIVVFGFGQPSGDFAQKFSKEYGKPPEIYSDIAYDTVYIIKFAIENCGYDSESARACVPRINITGASGQIYFGDKFYPENKQPVLEIIENGTFVRYGD